VFLALSIILKLFGVIDVDSIELLGYALIFYGINLVYTSFGKKQAGILFAGSSLFLTGLLLFLISSFEFVSDNEIIFPSILLILGINFLMLFFDDTGNKRYLAISIVSILSALIVTIFLGTITFQSYLSSVVTITLKYWPIIIIAIGLLILLNIENKRKL
jgi:hypothetical protein